MDGAPAVVERNRKPPRQILYGSGFVLDFNPDTAPGWPAIHLIRRAQVKTAAGIVRPAVVLVDYEIYTDGEIWRVEPDGTRKPVPEHHSESAWARGAMAAVLATATPPRDLVRWFMGPGTRRAEYNGAALARTKG